MKILSTINRWIHDTGIRRPCGLALLRSKLRETGMQKPSRPIRPRGRRAGAGAAITKRSARPHTRLFQGWTEGSSRGTAGDLSKRPKTQFAMSGLLPEIHRNIPDV